MMEIMSEELNNLWMKMEIIRIRIKRYFYEIEYNIGSEKLYLIVY